MSDWQATKVGLKLRIKRLAGQRYRRAVHAAWSMTNAEFWQYQAAAFKEAYEFATTRIPYYRDHPALYPPGGFDGGDVLAFLATLPVVDKMTVRENNEAFWPYPRLPFTSYHVSSGTTGTPIQMAATLWERGRTEAVISEWLFRVMGSRSPRMLSLSGFMTPSPDDPDLVWVDRLTRDAFLSIYSLNEPNRDTVISILERLRPQVIAGYPSAIHELARLVGDQVRSTRDQRVAMVTSEVLVPAHRAAIEDGLCRRVFNHYGSQEGSHHILECPAGNMHIHPLIGIVEIVDDDNQPVPAGEFGRILITGLARRSMPFIRYDLGDYVQSMGYAADCDCGLGWPMIGEIQGRSVDMILTRDNRRLALMGYVFNKCTGLKEAQLVQTGYENFTVNLVLDPSDTVDVAQLEASVQAELVKRLNAPAEVEFHYLSAIPRGARGKFKKIKVEFEPGEPVYDH